VGRRLGQIERAGALLDQATRAGNGVVPAGTATEADGDIAPVELRRAVHRLAHVKLAVAEYRIRSRCAEIVGRAAQGLPHQVVAEVRIRLPYQGRCAGHLWCGERGAAYLPVGGGGGAGD